MTDDDLDLVATDELLSAIGRRYDVLVVLGLRDLNTTEEERLAHWTGSAIASLGLLHMAERRIAASVEAESRDP